MLRPYLVLGLFLVAVSAQTSLEAQTVVAKDGNVIFTSKEGLIRQLTSGGIDSDPSISPDGTMVVFVRRTPDYKIDTGLGDVTDNELWVIATTGAASPKRVLRGRPGGFDSTKELVLAGFESPSMSPDGQRIYFVSTTWATSSAIHVLDLKTGRTQFLEAGHSVEVVASGEYSGYLLANLNIEPNLTRGRSSEYWLLDAEGRKVRSIGAEPDVKKFKDQYLSRD